MTKLFSIGKLHITAKAQGLLQRYGVTLGELLDKHTSGDYGATDDKFRLRHNDERIAKGEGPVWSWWQLDGAACRNDSTVYIATGMRFKETAAITCGEWGFYDHIR